MDAKLFGWAGRDACEREWDRIGKFFPTFRISGNKPRSKFVQVRAWDFYKRLGIPYALYRQLIGDCVSWGCKRTIESLQVADIAIRGDAERFEPLHASYLYAIGRVLIGKNELRGNDGSLGSWQAKACEVYGCVGENADDVRLPKYSAEVAKAWGDGRPYEGVEFGDFTEIGKKHLVKTSSRITTWEDLREAFDNGYFATVAFDTALEMTPGRDGFHDKNPNDKWPHQVAVSAVVEDGKNDHAGLTNSWADVHGQVTDSITGEPWPKGTLKVRREVFEREFLQKGEVIVYSSVDGYPARSLPWGDMIG
jgi:hypothetical protein